MKKKWNLLFLCLLLGLLLLGCSKTEGSSVEYQVYYISSSGTRLEEEAFTPGEGTPKTITEELLEKLGKPTAGSGHQGALPESVRIKNCLLGAKEISINFDREYYNMDPIREILVRAAFVKTLIQVPNVQSVMFTVEGEELVDRAGDVVGSMNGDSFIDTRGDGINSYQYGSLSLYFASQEGNQLVREMRNVHYSSNTTLEKMVVEQIIKGPANTKLKAVVPPETKILNVQVEDGVCTVNFDGTFNQDPEDASVGVEVSIYSIVNALFDNCKVKEVRIQIEGTSEVSYRNQLDLNQTFKRNREIVQQVASEEESDVLEPSVGMDALLKDYFF